MGKVYIVWAITQDCSEVHKICATQETAEEEKEQFLTHIALVKDDYKKQFGSDYNEDYKLIEDDKSNEKLDEQFHNFKVGYSYELRIESLYIQGYELNK